MPTVARHALMLLGVAAVVGLTSCRRAHDQATATPPPNDVFVIVTPTPGTPIPRTPMPRVGEQRYVVRGGDTLSVIAARFGVAPQAIQQANHLADANNIYAGQVLMIPPPEP